MKTLPWPLGLAALLLCPIVASARPSATEPPRLTLEQAQQLAAARNPELSSAQHEVDATSGGVQQAGAWRNPELTANVEDTRPATRTTTATLGFPLELGESGRRGSPRRNVLETLHVLDSRQRRRRFAPRSRNASSRSRSPRTGSIWPTTRPRSQPRPPRSWPGASRPARCRRSTRPGPR